MAHKIDPTDVLNDVADDIRSRLRDHLDDIAEALKHDADEGTSIRVGGVLGHYEAVIHNCGSSVECFITYAEEENAEKFAGRCFHRDTNTTIEAYQLAFLDAVRDLLSRGTEADDALSEEEAEEIQIKSDLFDYASESVNSDEQYASLRYPDAWWSLDVDVNRSALNLFVITTDSEGATVKRVFSSHVDNGQYEHAVKLLFLRAVKDTQEKQAEYVLDQYENEAADEDGQRNPSPNQTDLQSYACAKIWRDDKLSNLRKPGVSYWVELNNDNNLAAMNVTYSNVVTKKCLAFTVVEDTDGVGPYSAMDAALLKANAKLECA